VPGRDTLNVRVIHQSYSCCSNDCVTKFVSHNDMYHIHNQQRLSDLGPDMPELKVLIIGGRAAGKSSVSRIISRQFGRITRVASVSSLLHAPLVALTQRVLKQVLHNRT
jgi:predicted GTPase